MNIAFTPQLLEAKGNGLQNDSFMSVNNIEEIKD